LTLYEISINIYSSEIVRKGACDMYRKTTLALSLFMILAIILSSCSVFEKKRTEFSEKNGTYAAVDDLGRILAMPGDKRIPKEYREDKYVGVFYFLWHGTGDTSKVHDITKIMASDPEAAWKPELWGGFSVMHWWGEPLFGYYYANDEWVLRKHVQMLTDADVDFLVFDTTNNSVYADTALKLMAILYEYYQQGWDVPKVVFYTNTDTGKRMNQAYEQVYKKHPEYKDIWFHLDGKPLIIGRPEDPNTSDEVKEFFTIKHSQWPNEKDSTGKMLYHEDGFPWMAFERPQHVFGKSLGTTIISVSIAQHQSTVAFSDTALYGDDTNWTRSYHKGKNDKSEGAYLHGYNFQEQWDYAISQDPDIIFVTGWNEWIAGNWGPKGNKPLLFVDACDINTSRDAEPMKDGYGDNYYLQMIHNIRRFKGARPPVNATETLTIDISGGFDQWDNAKAVYTDYSGDTAYRNARGYGNVTYKNESGRNDIVTMKVAHDDNFIYFYVETKEDLTHPSDKHWMNLFISTGNKKNDNWYGYDFVVNRKNPDWDAYLEKCTGGFNWEEAAKLSFKYGGNKLQIAVPREALGLKGKKIDIQFKWADNYQEDDFWSFYTDGDAAPIGRMNYVYSETA
jgi:hypothetical protein